MPGSRDAFVLVNCVSVTDRRWLVGRISNLNEDILIAERTASSTGPAAWCSPSGTKQIAGELTLRDIAATALLEATDPDPGSWSSTAPELPSDVEPTIDQRRGTLPASAGLCHPLETRWQPNLHFGSRSWNSSKPTSRRSTRSSVDEVIDSGYSKLRA